MPEKTALTKEAWEAMLVDDLKDAHSPLESIIKGEKVIGSSLIVRYNNLADGETMRTLENYDDDVAVAQFTPTQRQLLWQQRYMAKYTVKLNEITNGGLGVDAQEIAQLKDKIVGTINKEIVNAALQPFINEGLNFTTKKTFPDKQIVNKDNTKPSGTVTNVLYSDPAKGRSLLLSHLSRARTIFRLNRININRGLYCLIDPYSLESLLQDEKLTSREYDRASALVNGEVTTAFGFTFIIDDSVYYADRVTTPETPATDSTPAKHANTSVVVFHPDAVMMGTAKDLSVDRHPLEKKIEMDIFKVYKYFGFLRRCDEGVVRIDIPDLGQ